MGCDMLLQDPNQTVGVTRLAAIRLCGSTVVVLQAASISFLLAFTIWLTVSLFCFPHDVVFPTFRGKNKAQKPCEPSSLTEPSRLANVEFTIYVELTPQGVWNRGPTLAFPPYHLKVGISLFL